MRVTSVIVNATAFEIRVDPYGAIHIDIEEGYRRTASIGVNCTDPKLRARLIALAAFDEDMRNDAIDPYLQTK